MHVFLTPLPPISEFYTCIHNFHTDIGTPCQGIQTAGPSTSETESEIGTPIAISIGITFIVTAIAVGFFGIVVCIVLCSYSKKKKQENKSNGHWRVYNEERKTRL